MKKSALNFLAGILSLIAFATVSKAQSITIQNGDFTDPTLGNGSYTSNYTSAGSVPDWTKAVASAPIGVQNFAGTGHYDTMPTASPNAVFDDDTTGSLLYQDLTGDGSLDFVAAGTYTLTVYGGSRNDKGPFGGSLSLYTSTGSLLGTEALVAPAQGYWALTTLTVEISPTNADIGDQLRVALDSTQNSTGFDDVTLSFAPAPEPSTWALLIAGLAFLGFGLRRFSPIRS